jgi:hypothetical protein
MRSSSGSHDVGSSPLGSGSLTIPLSAISAYAACTPISNLETTKRRQTNNDDNNNNNGKHESVNSANGDNDDASGGDDDDDQ